MSTAPDETNGLLESSLEVQAGPMATHGSLPQQPGAMTEGYCVAVRVGKEHFMDCVNHSGVTATAYCQNCGKALCATCARGGAGGQIFCEPCWTQWHSVQPPFVAPPPGAPSPGLAAVLGLIPGVGAMYNGQFIKGLVHVLIFAVLVSAAHIYGLFGLLIAGWVCYQVFDAYHTARARRDGEPLPDPLGLNDSEPLVRTQLAAAEWNAAWNRRAEPGSADQR